MSRRDGREARRDRIEDENRPRDARHAEREGLVERRDAEPVRAGRLERPGDRDGAVAVRVGLHDGMHRRSRPRESPDQGEVGDERIQVDRGPRRSRQRLQPGVSEPVVDRRPGGPGAQPGAPPPSRTVKPSRLPRVALRDGGEPFAGQRHDIGQVGREQAGVAEQQQAAADPAEVGAGVGVMARGMTGDDSLSLTELEGIVRACDRFEAAWRQGRGPRIEELLAGSPPHQRGALLRELVALEVELRRARGDSPTLPEYRGRFPEHAALIEALLEADPSAAGRTRSGEIPPILDRNLCVNDRYEVAEFLGRGGMGIVYRAYDRRRREFVALKTLTGFDPDLLYRFKREFRSLANVTHPNLVALYELTSDGQTWFFTMEFIDGRRPDLLRQRRSRPGRDRGRGDPRVVRTADDGSTAGLGVGIARATGPAAGRRRPAAARGGRPGGTARPAAGGDGPARPGGVGPARRGQAAPRHQALQRARGPGRPRRAPRLRPGGGAGGDGVAAQLRAAGRRHAAYMAPEQAAGRAVSPASDWYSVGAMLYEALTGRLPFTGQAPGDLLEKQRSDPPPPSGLVPDLPEDLVALCVDLLRRDPEARPPGPEVLRRLGVAAAAPDPRRPGAAGGRAARPPDRARGAPRGPRRRLRRRESRADGGAAAPRPVGDRQERAGAALPRRPPRPRRPRDLRGPLLRAGVGALQGARHASSTP